MPDGTPGHPEHVAPAASTLDAMLCFDLYTASRTISAVYRPARPASDSPTRSTS